MTLTYLHPDPRFAAEFLTEIHRQLDNSLRRKARDRATQYIDYLSRQLGTTTLIEHRNAIAQSLSEQERNRMLASSTLAFAAEPLDPVTTSLRPTTPRPAVILAIGLLGGITVGILAALARLRLVSFRKRERLADPA